MDDRRPDVLAGQRQGLVASRADLGVERGVVQRVGEFGGQAGRRQDRLEEGPGAAIAAIGPIGLGGGVEDPGADRRVQRPDRSPAVFGPGPRGDPQQPQPGGVPVLVAGREVAVVVDGRR